jgi:hypothetical protein
MDSSPHNEDLLFSESIANPVAAMTLHCRFGKRWNFANTDPILFVKIVIEKFDTRAEDNSYIGSR